MTRRHVIRTLQAFVGAALALAGCQLLTGTSGKEIVDGAGQAGAGQSGASSAGGSTTSANGGMTSAVSAGGAGGIGGTAGSVAVAGVGGSGGDPIGCATCAAAYTDAVPITTPDECVATNVCPSECDAAMALYLCVCDPARCGGMGACQTGADYCDGYTATGPCFMCIQANCAPEYTACTGGQ